ncbi:MAG TPA: preprotein translocase subunit SecY [Bacillota bacterium]|nr:preprotein translocase subunit SecY [Bacillota bacterium]HPP84839.1 preprotein translocase subunit SecY [Bacillota bacterium]
MWRIYKNAWSIDDIRKRMLFTLLIIVLFRIGSAVPVPFIDSQVWQDWFNNETVKGSFLEYFNMLSGDAFSKATLFSLGVNPYITASIVVQLLTVAIPALEKLQKSGPEGQEKISRIVRYTTLGLSILTSYGYYLTMKNYSAIVSTGVFEMFVIIIAYTAGSCMVMWIAEKIDEKGIGNGISILLFVNITAGLTIRLLEIFLLIREETIPVIAAVVMMLAIITAIVFFSESERRLPVQYAKRVVGRKMYGGMNTNLPIKVLLGGVMPIIFANAITTVPQTLAIIIPSWRNTIEKYFTPSSPSWGWLYVLVNFVLIIAFAYFYNSISFNTIEIANNLKKNGGTILGYRPGKPTADYIQKVVNRITLIGSLFLSFVAIFPILMSWTGEMAFRLLIFGGTSIIIIVGVALETTRTIESEITMRHYKGFLE